MVKHQAEFGVFVDIGANVLALLRITDFSLSIKPPLKFSEDYPAVGSTIAAQVIWFETDPYQIFLTQQPRTHQEWDDIKRRAHEAEQTSNPAVIPKWVSELKQPDWGRLVISRVFEITGRGTVAAGSLVSGIIQVGMFTQPLLIGRAFEALKVSAVEFVDYLAEAHVELGLFFESNPSMSALQQALPPRSILTLSKAANNDAT